MHVVIEVVFSKQLLDKVDLKDAPETLMQTDGTARNLYDR